MLVGHQTAGWLVLLVAPGLNHDTSPKARGTKRPPELFMESTKYSFCATMRVTPMIMC